MVIIIRKLLTDRERSDYEWERVYEECIKALDECYDGDQCIDIERKNITLLQLNTAFNKWIKTFID